MIHSQNSADTPKTSEAVKNLISSLYGLLAPPEQISTKDWSNKYRYLSSTGSDSAGKYSSELTPFWHEVMDVLDDPNYRMVVCMKSAQVGWTEVLNNYIGKRIDIDPCGIIIMFSKEGAAKEYNEEKFRPMVTATKRLQNKVSLKRGIRDGTRELFKKFPDGFLKMVGSNSPASVKSTPAPVVIVEEPDDANQNVQGQGNTIKLLMERTKSFSEPKIIYGGTPTLKGVSEIESAYLRSDQRKLFVPCHHCGEKHVLDFDNLKCPEDIEIAHPVYGVSRYQDAFYACPHCGSTWNDEERVQNVYEASILGWTKTAVSDVAGFYINELYSPFPGSVLGELKKKELEAQHEFNKGDETDLIAFVNSSKGLPYEYQTDAPEEDELANAALDYPELVVPMNAYAVTAGVDVQHDRLAVVLRAHGPDDESWLIFWGEISGETNHIDSPVWLELDKLLFSGFKHESGSAIGLAAGGIDSSDGATNDVVYSYVRKRQHKNMMATKGWSEQSAEKEIYTLPKKIDHKSKTKASKKGLLVYMIGTQKVKDLISEKIKRETEGSGIFHFYKSVRSDYFEQMLSEVKVPSRHRRGRLVWQKKPGVRNEALDCEGIAEHAKRAARIHLFKPSDWDRLKNKVHQSDLFSEPAASEQQAKAETIVETAKDAPQKKRRKKRGRKGFINNW